MTALGTVYLVGAGPGAPDLLTVRAQRLLEQADIVFHDALVHKDTVAIAAKAAKVAVGKRCGRHSAAQHFINKRLIDAAGKYSTVVRLKGGDPMIFGRSQEEIDALEAAGIEVEVVPGITAALAAAAQMRVSLTRRGMSRSLTLVTPRVGAGSPDGDWSTALARTETAAIYMGAAQSSIVRQGLLDQGFDRHTPVAICESASLTGARVLRGCIADLPALSSELGDGPAIILVGKVLERVASAAGATAAQDDCEPSAQPQRLIAR